MKVKELAAALVSLDPELEVLVSKDEEGNGFKALYEVAVSKAYKDNYNTWETVHEDDVAEYMDDDLATVVVLWP